MTHAFNAFNLIFPEGEQFFIRSVRRYRSQLTDPEQRKEVNAYIGQEAQHAMSHRRAQEILVEQGFELDGWLKAYARGLSWLERWGSPALCLSVTVALEHYTAGMSERGLTEGHLDRAHPEMGALLKWHCAEEIEHKAVAFDVFQAVDGRWSLRVLGMLVASLLMLVLWLSAAVYLVRQDDQLSLRRMLSEFITMRRAGLGLTRFLRRDLLPYLHPGFHPNDRDDRHLVEQCLEQMSDRLTGTGR